MGTSVSVIQVGQSSETWGVTQKTTDLMIILGRWTRGTEIEKEGR